jgi:hypothetical protein
MDHVLYHHWSLRVRELEDVPRARVTGPSIPLSAIRCPLSAPEAFFHMLVRNTINKRGQDRADNHAALDLPSHSQAPLSQLMPWRPSRYHSIANQESAALKMPFLHTNTVHQSFVSVGTLSSLVTVKLPYSGRNRSLGIWCLISLKLASALS